jgi:hypothetical protein
VTEKRSIYDYSADAVGQPTIKETIDLFRAEDTNWQVRDDWQGLTQRSTESSPVLFTNERGWVYLAVDLMEHNGSWLISGFRSCSPPIED